MYDVNEESKSPCCCCCYSDVELQSMLEPHDYNGKSELYTRMIAQCFGIHIMVNTTDIDKDLYLLCKTCVSYLRDAFHFRHRIKNAHNRIRELSNRSIHKVERKLESGNTCLEIKYECWLSDDEMNSNDPFPLNIKREPESTSEYGCQMNAQMPDMFVESGSKDQNLKSNSKDESQEFNPDVRAPDSFSNDRKRKKIPGENTKYYKTKKVNEKSVPQFELNENDLTCKICNETFAWHRMLKSHMAVHFPNYVCHICSKAFTVQKNLQSHIRHHEQVKMTVACEICNKVFKGNDNLNRHMRYHYSPSGIYKCPRCHEKFSTFHKRMRHLVDVHNEEAMKYHCKQCTKRFNSNDKLTIHVRMVHRNEKRYTCDVCDMSFFQKRDLTRHIVVHTGVKNFHCELCNKSFSRNSNLRVHMKIHSDVKKFACSICDRAFKYNSSLKAHMKVHDRISSKLLNK